VALGRCERQLRAPFDWRARPSRFCVLPTIMASLQGPASKCHAKANVIRYVVDSTRRWPRKMKKERRKWNVSNRFETVVSPLRNLGATLAGLGARAGDRRASCGPSRCDAYNIGRAGLPTELVVRYCILQFFSSIDKRVAPTTLLTFQHPPAITSSSA
jgi:hypothetical protein